MTEAAGSYPIGDDLHRAGREKTARCQVHRLLAGRLYTYGVVHEKLEASSILPLPL
jgi:hypothetical protein